MKSSAQYSRERPSGERAPGQGVSRLQEQSYGPVVDQLDLHVGSKDAGPSLECLAEPHVKGFGHLGPGSPDIAGPIAPVSVAIERELTDAEHRSGAERLVHPSRVVIEDPQLPDLVREAINLLLAVPVADPEQNQETGSDLTDRIAVDRDPRRADPLNQRPHDSLDSSLSR